MCSNVECVATVLYYDPNNEWSVAILIVSTAIYKALLLLLYYLLLLIVFRLCYVTLK